MINSRTQSLFHGYHIPFEDNESSIDYWFSAWSGKEKVFVDGNLVSSKRNYSKKSKHTFSIGSDRYSLDMNVTQLLTGTTTCSLEKNGNRLKQFRWSLLKPKKNRILSGPMKAIILYIFFFVLYGALLHGGMYFELPRKVILWSIGTLLIVIIYYIYTYGDGSKPDIEEQNAA